MKQNSLNHLIEQSGQNNAVQDQGVSRLRQALFTPAAQKNGPDTVKKDALIPTRGADMSVLASNNNTSAKRVKQTKHAPEKPKPPPNPDAFSSRQMDMFRGLLCNTETERETLSNVLDLWDSVPRYVVSRMQQDKWRKAGTFPALHEVRFHYRGRELVATIQPANIKGKDGVIRTYYPSANEELVEDVLRKIAADQGNGYYEHRERRSGVVFTLHAVRKELAKRGHMRNYVQISLSLDIMARSVIVISTADGKKGQFTSNSLYLNNLFRASKDILDEEPDAKWSADFHPFASQAFDDLTYRQFNYARMMRHKSQLARWLNKVLSLKYVNASTLQPFEMHYSTIARDSGLLNGYSAARMAVAAVDAALDELQDSMPPILSSPPEKRIIEGARGKILDVIYTIHPSMEFIMEVKAANKRVKLIAEKTMFSDEQNQQKR
ncbi:replication protein [Candidatus Methylospira mobilis]|uniref:replication protein n=1 Tax=Candidatus Methylospira mobilis TaxID=1808979 RepID=UPI0028EE33F9|nr:replication protein [Candidatus Methylospira mobilis]WNV05826.1 replication protein [Candidatus Methylospira mobilis]